MDNCLIYDFETMGEVKECAAVSLALYKFNEDRFLTNPYSYMEIVDNCKYIKFDIQEQVQKYDRVIEKATLEWWAKLPVEARSIINPSPNDVSISDLWNHLTEYTSGMDFKKVYTRGNSYDPIIMENLLHVTGFGVPYPWWTIRDTRSTIEGLSWGSGLKHSFIVEECKDQFVAHDARHDIAMDVMRLQTLVQTLYGDG